MKKNKSLKTTIAGIIAALIPVLAALSAFLDDDPATIPNWTAAFSAVGVAFGFLFARDNNVSSEEAGAK